MSMRNSEGIFTDDIEEILNGALEQYKVSTERDAADVAAQQATESDAQLHMSEIDSAVKEIEKLLGELKSELHGISMEQVGGKNLETVAGLPMCSEESVDEIAEKFSNVEKSLRSMMDELEPLAKQERKSQDADHLKPPDTIHEDLLEGVSRMQKQWDLFE